MKTKKKYCDCVEKKRFKTDGGCFVFWFIDKYNAVWCTVCKKPIRQSNECKK